MTTRFDEASEREVPDDNDQRRWAYQTVFGGMGAQEATKRLNHLGENGWELVAVVPPHNPSGETVLYLKRPEPLL
jgi:hypothetical protein